VDSAKARQPSLYRAIATVTGFTERIAAVVCGLLVIVMLVIVSLQIFARTIGITVSWTEEASRYILIWLGMLAAGIAHKQGGHAAVGFVTDALPRNAQLRIRIAMNLAILVFMLVFFWTGLRVAIDSTAILASAFEITMFWPKMAIPVGSVFLVLNTAFLIADDVTKMKYGEEGVKR
jgi:TRAP-type C4-dicarboxylate transport system permease small subunit